ncbi:MAG: EF-hand domain-containing protein [Silicimonas sp.]|nr:EF-hand domain-containing protein [Silicimonas sp.]NNL34364.1 EF-hand domain-containing protein [Silicimonas sp.]NNL72663.1 EF-hand domain-containing protein [Silicimonas sp.]
MKLLICSAVATILTTVSASAASIHTFDANGDRFVSFDEVVAINAHVKRSEFRDLDVNRDRRLSSVELQAPGAEAILNRGVNTLGTVHSVGDIAQGRFVSLPELAQAYPGLRAHEYDIIDTNNDGRVSSNELYASAAQAILGVHEQNESILVSLDSVDTDGSGFASLAEIQVVYRGATPNDLHELDINRDGRISFTEFYTLRTIEVLGEKK